MSLLVAIQEALDIAFHICADEDLGVPSSYRDGFDLLEREGVIPSDLCVALKGCVSLRNRIAHGYASVDADRMHAELPAGIDAAEPEPQAPIQAPLGVAALELDRPVGKAAVH